MDQLDALFGGNQLSNGDLLQQIALLAWVKGGDNGKQLMESVTTLRVGREIYNRLTGEALIEQYRKECILGITKYIKDHPRASEKETQAEVTKQIQLFAARVSAL
ncbi:uncharacterized protein LOC135485444 [Lineus longissimus]|uniref:uncharacterized protein LOC135485444 n=1 Tax=Lineus longissimus TaxID=88925 RepID=UPI002B4E3148